MQRLNDLYSKERSDHVSLQKTFGKLSDDMGRLQTELEAAAQDKAEVSRLQRLNGELNEALKKAFEENASTQRQLQTSGKEIAALKAKIAEASEHCWNIAEELRQAKLSCSQEREMRGQVEEQLAALVSQQNAADNVIKTLTSNLRKSEMLTQSADEEVTRRMQTLEAETLQLREILQSSNEEKDFLKKSLQKEEAERRREKSLVSTAIKELTEAVNGAKARNEGLSTALADARNHLVKVTDDNLQLEQRVTELEALMEREAIKFQDSINASRSELRTEKENKEDILRKVASASTQIELLQSQLMESHERYRETLQQQKQINDELRIEVAALQRSNEELQFKVKKDESDMREIRDLMQSEASATSHMTNSLRDELEKRLQELLNLRKERDSLLAEKDSFLMVASEREKSIQRKEEAFQKALEGDRARLQQELKSAVSRFKELEKDKNELLQENSDIAGKLLAMQSDLTKITEELNTVGRQRDDVKMQLVESKARLVDTLEELKAANRDEQNLRDESVKMERLFKEEVHRLEVLVKESKREAVSQVAQLSGNLKVASEEIASLKAHIEDILTAEKNAVVEVDNLRNVIILKTQAYEYSEGKLTDEIALLKAELNVTMEKLQRSSEVNAQLEIEKANLAQSTISNRSDLEKLRGKCSEIEIQLRDEKGEREQLKAKLASTLEAYNSMKLKYVEVNEAFLRQTKDYEDLHEAYSRAEREGMAEARGLRVTLSTANIEIKDLKSLLDNLRQELTDSKTSLARLQSSSSSTIAALSDELRNTEDRFGEYRKASQGEQNELHQRIIELSSAFERSKESLEEALVKSKAEKSVRRIRKPIKKFTGI